MLYIRDNIDWVRNEINSVCKKIGRDPKEIKLIAVTKTIDTDIINEAVAYGINEVGENRVQEITEKYDKVLNVEWHMIGHLQTNKVKYIIDKVKLIHSLDRKNLAFEINKRAKDHNLVADVLVQVNVAKEETKFGLDIKEVYNFIESIEELKNISIKGLMTIAPYTDDPEEVRVYFKGLRDIFNDIKENNYQNVEMKYLSMGMTNDFKIAIEEGANIVRVGTAIFGNRNYNK